MKLRVLEVLCGKFRSGLTAEMKVEASESNGDGVWYANVFVGTTSVYSVSRESIYDYYAGKREKLPELAEEYGGMGDASASEFVRCFEYLDSLIPIAGDDMSYDGGIMGCLEHEKRSFILDITSKEKYSASVESAFLYDGKKYRASVVYGSEHTFDGMVFTHDVTDYSICDDSDSFLEGYGSLEEAAASEWLILWCDMDRELRGHMREWLDKRRAENPEVMTRDDFEHLYQITGK